MTYRLAHLSDWHAGYRSGHYKNSQDVNIREMDGYQTLARMVKDIINVGVDGVVIAGDIYHSPNPEIRSHIVVQNLLRKLWAAGISVYMLAGNHDTNDVKADIAASRILHDPWRNIYSHAEPYVRHEIADGIHLHLVSHHMYSEQSETMKQIKPIPGEINIFSTHGSCIDPLLEEKLKAESSPREIVIPDFLLKDNDWSYSLLGHIHERGWVGSGDGLTDTYGSQVYYNGSAIRRGFSDKPTPLGRGWTLWTISEDGVFEADPRTIPQRPQFDFDMLDASQLSTSELNEKILENLRASQGENGTELDLSTAPILRQRVSNLTPSKRAGLDLKALDYESGHAFSWKIHPTWNIESPTPSANTEDDDSEGLDILSTYDRWAENAEAIQQTDESIRKGVQKQAREFVSLGLEKSFEEE